jgi:hypothetical protein
MTRTEHLALVLSEVGPAFDEVEQIEALAENAWVVVFDQETAIEVHLDAVGHCLNFIMPLGPVKADDREKAYEMLLSYNFLKQDTGGFHMALDGDAGNVLLMLDVHHTDIEVYAMTAILATLLELGQNWRDVLAGDRQADDVDLPHIGDPSGGTIRV